MKSECAAPTISDPNVLFRPLPDAALPFVIEANRVALSCPFGRALYILNRKLHTWPYTRDLTCTLNAAGYAYRPKTSIEVMESMRAGTAERWLAHWNSGGSLESLALSVEQAQARARRYAQQRQEEKERRMSEPERLRLELKRARRRGRKEGVPREWE